MEFKIMECFWRLGEASIRDVHESIQGESSRDYTTIQTVVYRLEKKHVLERVGKMGNRHIFRALMTRHEAQGKQVDRVLDLLGGRYDLLVAHLIASRSLNRKDLREAKHALQRQAKTVVRSVKKKAGADAR